MPYNFVTDDFHTNFVADFLQAENCRDTLGATYNVGSLESTQNQC